MLDRLYWVTVRPGEQPTLEYLSDKALYILQLSKVPVLSLWEGCLWWVSGRGKKKKIHGQVYLPSDVKIDIEPGLGKELFMERELVVLIWL